MHHLWRRLAAGAVGILAATGPLPGAPPAEAAFPGPNGQIAFMSDRAGDGEIFAMNPDGTGQVNLTNNAAFDSYPDWSPDGTKIAFASDVSAPGNPRDIHTMNADGTGVTRVTTHPADELLPAWSPDGTKIAFQRDFDIWVVNLDGSGETNLTNTFNRAEEGPDWSPDGTKIAFNAIDFVGGFGTNHDIYVMNADGTGVVNMTNAPWKDLFPDWSPDGTKLVYMSDESCVPFCFDHIWVINVDGSGKTQLTFGDLVDQFPAWSPDGTKIVFERDSFSGTSWDVYVMNADGSGVTPLAATGGSDQTADWGTNTNPTDVGQGGGGNGPPPGGGPPPDKGPPPGKGPPAPPPGCDNAPPGHPVCS